MKTSELTGPALDWAVELALGTHWSANGYFCHDDTTFNKNPEHSYSTDWSQGGPLIERARISIRTGLNPGFNWAAFLDYGGSSVHRTKARCSGPTPLIAAMRCFVASRLGDEVDLPAALSSTV